MYPYLVLIVIKAVDTYCMEASDPWEVQEWRGDIERRGGNVPLPTGFQGLGSFYILLPNSSQVKPE